MPFGKPRTDVRTALKEALSSGVQVKIKFRVFDNEYEDAGYVKLLAEDRIIFGRNKDDHHGVPTMLADITTVFFWDEPGEPRRPHPGPEPVDNPQPTSGSPGKEEKIPVPDNPVKATAS